MYREVLHPKLKLALVPIAIAVLALNAGCRADADPAETATAASDPPGLDAARPAQPPERKPGLELDTPRHGFALIWVRVHERARLRSQPGGGELIGKVGRRTEFGSTSAFGVVRQSGDWAAVTTPLLPNGQLAWVRLNPDRLRAGWTKTSIVVDLSERRAALLQAGEPERTFAITVGMPGSETPTGRFAVTDAFRGNLNPAYGCCAVALSATQPHLPSGWLGGRRIAIHGTYGTLGVAASHGCVRAADEDVSELVDRVPLGAPVFIRE